MKFDISLYFLLFVVALGVAEYNSQDYDESSEDDRIVGGVNALTGENSYQASLREALSGNYFCGAVIISTEWLLTSAFCVTGRTPSSMYVAVGSKYLTFGYTRYDVKLIVSHPSYNPVSGLADIAMINTITGMALGISPELNRVKISSLYPSDNQTVLMSGWGATSTPSIIPNTLQVLKTRTINVTECKSQLSPFGITVTPSHLCTVTKIGEGACFGDSGSPVTWNNTLIALISVRGVPCGQGYPDVNTAIRPYITWIGQTIIANIFE